MLKNTFILIVTILISISCAPQKENVDTIVHHAIIYSVDSAFTTFEAMAIKDGKILELNANDSILKKYTSKNTIDAQGKAVFPGLIDAHCHFTGYATDMWKCNLTGTASFEEVLEKITSNYNYVVVKNGLQMSRHKK